MRAALTPVASLPPAALDAWRHLGNVADEPCPFSEADMVSAASRHLVGGQESQLLQVWDGDRLLLALPLRRGRLGRRLPLPAWCTWVHPYCFLGGPLVVTEEAARAWAEALQFLRRSLGPPWMRLDLLPTEGAAAAGLSAAAGATGLSIAVVAEYERAVVRRLHAERSETASSRQHRSLHRLRRRLVDHLQQDVNLVDRTGEAEAVTDFLALEASGWKGRAGTAMAAREGDAAFLRELQDNWPERVQLLFLMSGDRVLAAQVNLLARQSCFAFKVAYDERLAHYSPGTQLELDVLAWFARSDDLVLLDSCAEPGHSIERLFPHRRALRTVVVPLSSAARLTSTLLPRPAGS